MKRIFFSFTMIIVLAAFGKAIGENLYFLRSLWEAPKRNETAQGTQRGNMRGSVNSFGNSPREWRSTEPPAVWKAKIQKFNSVECLTMEKPDFRKDKN